MDSAQMNALSLLLLAIALSALTAHGASGPLREQVVRIHAVTPEEYEELIRVTQGKSEVSQARLISSSLAGISGLATGAFLPSLFSSNTKPTTTKGYPLCVISTSEADEAGKSVGINWGEIEDSDSSNNHGHGHHGHGSSSGSSGNKGDSSESTGTVNCILVVKKGSDDSDDDKEPYVPVRPSRPGNGTFPFPPFPPIPPFPPGNGTYPFPPFSMPPQSFYPPYWNSFYPWSGGYGFYPPPPAPPLPPVPPPDRYLRSFSETLGRLYNSYDSYNDPVYYQRYSAPKRTRGSKRSRANQPQHGGAYQPASYPQQEYASNYPKVTRNYGLPYPAPIYVKSSQYDEEH